MTHRPRKFYKRIVAIQKGKIDMICEVPNRQSFHEMLKYFKHIYAPGEIHIDTPKRRTLLNT
jgi:hypothetical protein